MATQSINSRFDSDSPVRLDLLRLAFFLLGAPRIYGALRHRSFRRSKSSTPKAWSLVVLAMAIAGLLELWIG
jgi:hypothetical protein